MRVDAVGVGTVRRVHDQVRPGRERVCDGLRRRRRADVRGGTVVRSVECRANMRLVALCRLYVSQSYRSVPTNVIKLHRLFRRSAVQQTSQSRLGGALRG